MNKVAHYLQEHVVGEVMTGTDARQYFSTDNSIFTITPSVIVYPKNENDVRKTARFCWQLAERGRKIPVTARGNGTDLTGAALGAGIMLAFPAHLNHVLYNDDKSGQVSVEAGINFGKLQQLLESQGRFIPAAPFSAEYSSVGGALANNASSVRSFKYGDMRSYVSGLRVVLANGEVIETGRLSKKDLSRKLGYSTFEGEIYRSLDALIDENKSIIDKSILAVSRNASGYDIADVKLSDGSFDLTPLLVGSQGTLGLVTEVTLDTIPKPVSSIVIAAYLNAVSDIQNIVLKLIELEEKPSAIELVDANLLSLVANINANYLKEVIAQPYPKFVMLIELNADRDNKLKKTLTKTEKILRGYTNNVFIEENPDRQKLIWKVRESSSLLSSHNQGLLNPLPLIDDGVVPITKLTSFIKAIYTQFASEHLQVAIWGHAGDGNLHVQPFLNLGQVGDRQKAFRMLDDYCRTVIELGGSISGRYNDGRLRGPYLSRMYTDDVYKLFLKVKNIFDPFGILNPGVKLNTSTDSVKPLIRGSYKLEHVYDHLPLT